ncbi:MAG: SpoIVB peptidase S55 domain-containing protein, partial [Oscillospiraceae bacterium]
QTELGDIETNTPFGIFGVLTSFPGKNDGVETVSDAEIKIGKASILSNISGTEVKEYEIEILKVNQHAKDGKSLVIKVTDENLLDKTGGIVQGMSGSPILQDGKLVGAVTHVLVSDPARGYGISIDSMLAAAG